MPFPRVAMFVIACSIWTLSCGDEAPQTIPDHCDPLVPEFCAFPFPSNRWLVDDPSMPSGKRVEIHPLALPLADNGAQMLGEPLRYSDGFSPGNELITFLPGMSLEGLADADHIEASLEPGSLTVIIDEATGERVPHWAELDMRSSNPEQRALLIRPAVRLEDEHTYIVAVRGVVDEAGAVIPPSPAFVALRDGKRFPHPSIAARRARYVEILAALEGAGVPRESLQIAWDMTVSSQENQTARMLHVRDVGLEQLGLATPDFVIDDVVDAPQAGVARQIDGHVTVPLFLDDDVVGSRAVLDEEGLPMQNGEASFPFRVLITENAVTGETDPVIQYGHGLFGRYQDVSRSDFVALANSMGAVCVSVDWLGMTTYDAAQIASIVLSGKLEDFVTVPDRGMQGMLNAMYALRAVRLGLPSHTSTEIEGAPVFSPGATYFVGNSLGGIYGSTYASLSPDLERAVLFVPGQPFSLLLPRAEPYELFKNFLDMSYASDMRQHPYMLALLQMLWDRVEPTGFSNHVLDDPFPGSASPDVLLVDAIGDPSVTTRGARIMARTMGLTSLAPANREVYGVPESTDPVARRAFLEVSFGLPPEPVFNISVPQTPNPHDLPIGTEGIRAIARDFLETGVATSTCDGPCDPD